MTSPNFMVIGLQIRKLHRRAEPGLFRVKTIKAGHWTFFMSGPKFRGPGVKEEHNFTIDYLACNP